MNKKRLVGTILAAIFTFSQLISCGSSKVEVDSDTIVVWANMRNVEIIELQKLADSWTAENNPKVIIFESEGTGKSFVDIPEKGRPDIFFGGLAEDTHLLSKASAVDTVPQDLIKEEEYISSDLIQATTFEGKQYGVPVTQETVALYYNKDKVNKAPDTMEELIEIAKDKGFSFELSNYYFSYGFVAAFGGYLFKNNDGVFDYKNLGVNNEGAIKGYKFMQDLVVKDSLFLGGATDIMASSQFSTDKTAFYIGEAGRVRTFKEAGVNFDVAPIPTVNGQDVTPLKFVKMACVSSNSDKKEDSWDLIKYLSKGTDEVFMKSGPYPPIYKTSLESETFKNDEYIKGLYKQSLISMPLPNVLEAKAFDIVINAFLSELVLGKITPEECGEFTEKALTEDIKDLFTY